MKVHLALALQKQTAVNRLYTRKPSSVLRKLLWLRSAVSSSSSST